MSENLTKDEIIKEEIISSAQKLFIQFGIAKTTMEDIAKATGKGKSTLYYYFKNKEEIFTAVLDKEINEIAAEINLQIDSVDSATDKLKAYIITTSLAISKKINLYHVIKGEIKDYWKIVGETKEKYNRLERKKLSEIISLGVKNKEFKTIDEENFGILSYVLVTTIGSLAEDLLFGTESPDLISSADTFVDLIVNGIKK